MTAKRRRPAFAARAVDRSRAPRLWCQAMSREAERTARPGSPLGGEPARTRPGGADGAAPAAGARVHGRSTGSAVAYGPSHRPVDAYAAAPGGAGRAAAGSAAALDLHEGICDPAAGGCERWPEHLRLLNHVTGELVRGRCRATNLCVYCQRLYVVETVEMLTLDALEYAPTLWLVLTAREHLTRADTYSHLRQLRKAARRRWPAVEWFVQVEFQRRGALHLNLLVKGVAGDDLEPFASLLISTWCARVDALSAAQWADVVNDGYGVTRYISKMLAHGLKAEQAPPFGWTWPPDEPTPRIPRAARKRDAPGSSKVAAGEAGALATPRGLSRPRSVDA